MNNVRPLCTFITNISSESPISFEQNTTTIRACIPGEMISLFPCMGFTMTRKLERYGLASIWNLAGRSLTFCNVTIFCGAKFVITKLTDTRQRWNRSVAHLVHLSWLEITKLYVISVHRQYHLIMLRLNYTLLHDLACFLLEIFPFFSHAVRTKE